MKFQLRFVPLIFVAAVSSAAYAAQDHKGHDHGGNKSATHAHDAKAQYGGIVVVVKDVNYELVAKPGELTLYMNDHGESVDTKGATSVVTLLSGAEKTEVTLAPAGGNRMQGKGSFNVSPGTKAVARVALPGKPAEHVRFTIR